MIEIGSVASGNTNLTLRNVDALYSSGDNYSRASGVRAGEGTVDASMDFDDVLDMLNPLEHIPVVSSLYRAITDEPIHPVARIAGDALYGGIMGVASAGIAALGAIGDEVIAANNDGMSLSGVLVASLSGDEEEQTIQVADAKTAPSDPNPINSIAFPALVSAQQVQATDDSDESSSKGLLLDRAKQPYGGVLDTAMLANAQQNQALALALAGQRQAHQTERNLRNSRFAVPPAQTAAVSSNKPADTASTATVTASVEPETQAAMQNLLQELLAMRGVKHYENAAQAAPVSGERLNLVN